MVSDFAIPAELGEELLSFVKIALAECADAELGQTPVEARLGIVVCGINVFQHMGDYEQVLPSVVLIDGVIEY